MTAHSGLLDRYRRLREVGLRLNNRLVRTIPKKTILECGRELGFLRDGTLVFETEDETALLMDYCLYHPGRDGRNLVAKYLEKSPPPADSDEMAILRAMTHAYYSLFHVVAVERGVGLSVMDVLRHEPGFIVDVGLGSTAGRKMLLATRIIPGDGFLMTGGAALPIDGPAGDRLSAAMGRSRFADQVDFKRISPQLEADLVALIIRECREKGLTSRISYESPGSPPPSPPAGPEVRRPGRNDPCPCGSGKKFKACHGRTGP